jgi:1-acyl-sn-glycerol-3-phosphate acyltransferase
MQWLRSLVFTTFFFACTLLYGVVIVCAVVLPYRRRFPLARAWARTQLWAVRVLCGLDYTVEGVENIPKTGSHISYWRHSSAWETIAQALIFPPQAWVLKREILWIPFVGWATMLLKPIAIDRSAHAAAVHQVVSQGSARLSQGIWVLIFPEGTRVAVGERRRYGLSGALLASQSGAKIVPVAHNAGRFWAKRGLLKSAGTIRVVIGPAIETAGRDPRDISEEARAWIDAKVEELGG